MDTTATATAATATLTLDGTHAVITGVRFVHQNHCSTCRHYVEVFTDGGTVKAGISVSHSGKTVRWYGTSKAGAKPIAPETCGNCGETGSPFSSYDWSHGSPIGGYLALLNQAWATFRAGYPDLAAAADLADRRAEARAAARVS
jgi:hypothetical protein